MRRDDERAVVRQRRGDEIGLVDHNGSSERQREKSERSVMTTDCHFGFYKRASMYSKDTLRVSRLTLRQQSDSKQAYSNTPFRGRLRRQCGGFFDDRITVNPPDQQ